MEKIEAGMNFVITNVNEYLDSEDEETQMADDKNKPVLTEPTDRSISIFNIELGTKKALVEDKLGEPQRSTMNEYGIEWHAYHNNYHSFMMVAYNKSNQVVGLYTNQDLISSKQGFTLGSSKETVLKQLGEPITKIQKGLVIYQMQNDGEYHMFHLDNSYITVFYDQHENDTVTAIQVISENIENKKRDFYTKASKALKEGFEYQLFDLTNAARVKHGLNPLSFDHQVKQTARDHSMDMAKNNYFSHTNLEGKSPFDRMTEDNISYRVAGENLASGQLSSIFAHEGLMNSKGHRKNILHKEYKSLGVGVAFDADSKPYYTENFLTK